jgi:hypothetical protein
VQLGKGGRGKKNDESDVHLPQLQKNRCDLLHFCFYLSCISSAFLSRFWAFRDKGSKKTR